MIVDVQNDFLPGGALAVPEGDAIIPVINTYIRAFQEASCPVLATRDWHPEDHCSFSDYGGPWPAHCIQGTKGAEFPSKLKLPENALIISKAQSKDKDAYSGFEGTDLAKTLRSMGIKRMFICGLATDYCVRATVMDALGHGFSVVVLQDAIRAVDLTPGDGEKALADMEKAGAVLQDSGTGS